MVARNKVAVGTFVLLKEHPRIPDGPCSFYRFVVNGPVVEVTVYEDSDLIGERDYDRAEAREIWRKLISAGYRED